MSLQWLTTCHTWDRTRDDSSILNDWDSTSALCASMCRNTVYGSKRQTLGTLCAAAEGCFKGKQMECEVVSWARRFSLFSGQCRTSNSAATFVLPPVSFVTLFCLPPRTMRLSVSCTSRCMPPLPLSYSIDEHLIWNRITVLWCIFSLLRSSILFSAFKHKEPRTKEGSHALAWSFFFFFAWEKLTCIRSVDKYNPALSWNDLKAKSGSLVNNFPACYVRSFAPFCSHIYHMLLLVEKLYHWFFFLRKKKKKLKNCLSATLDSAVKHSLAACWALFVNPLCSVLNEMCCLASIPTTVAVIWPFQTVGFLSFLSVSIPDWGLICAAII